MKSLAYSVLAAIAVMATPAAAQDATGTITLTGNVAPKCQVLSEGPATNSFVRSIDFGELAAADGTLRTGLNTEFNGQAFTARVICTTAAPNIAVDADAMANTVAADPGYDNSIDYNAVVDLEIVGGSAQFTNDSADPALGATPVGGRLANSATNVAISAESFRTNAPTDVLVAGSYSGQILITISPGA